MNSYGIHTDSYGFIRILFFSYSFLEKSVKFCKSLRTFLQTVFFRLCRDRCAACSHSGPTHPQPTGRAGAPGPVQPMAAPPTEKDLLQNTFPVSQMYCSDGPDLRPWFRDLRAFVGGPTWAFEEPFFWHYLSGMSLGGFRELDMFGGGDDVLLDTEHYVNDPWIKHGPTIASVWKALEDFWRGEAAWEAANPQSVEAESSVGAESSSTRRAATDGRRAASAHGAP